MSKSGPKVTFKKRLGAWVALGRPSNLPTLWADALVGVVLCMEAMAILGTWPWGVPRDFSAAWAIFLSNGWLVWVGLSLIYMGGMALNDWVDAERDRKSKADRPIPSGLIARDSAGAAGVVMLSAGVICLSMLSVQTQWLAWILVAAVVAYDLLHTKWIGSVVIMGLCRGLAILVGGSVIATNWATLLGIALPLAAIATGYVALLSVVARTEAALVNAKPDAEPTWTRWGLIVLPLVAMIWVWPHTTTQWIAVLVTGVLLVGWLLLAQRHLTARPPRIGSAVAWYIAGIAMVDAWFLALLGRPVLAGVAVVLAVATLGLQRVVKGT